MRRQILWSAAALALLAGGSLLANSLALYARVKLDRSFPALSRYEFEPTPDIVLVGSSMTFRLYEHYFAQPGVRNLAISGGSSLTGTGCHHCQLSIASAPSPGLKPIYCPVQLIRLL